MRGNCCLCQYTAHLLFDLHHPVYSTRHTPFLSVPINTSKASAWLKGVKFQPHDRMSHWSVQPVR